MSLTILYSFILTFIVSLVTVPIVGKITKNMGIIAEINKRTIHSGVIPRTGGYAIYIAFLVGASFFLKTDNQINSMMIGGLIIFLVGLYDDIHNLPPKLKLLGQILAALVVILYGGISLKDFTIPYIPTNISYVLAIIITIGWIIGITNAINLIDGLDGLCAGISIIVLFTISLTSATTGRTDITSLSLLLIGAIGGFLVYNFHPAKIFMGDCGALFIGFMISVISLLGFGYKGTTFFTLGAPIVVLAIPIMDTFLAIIRRKVHHQRFDEADRGHLHHKLMFSLELGQTKSVITLYIATALFSLCSYLNLNHKVYATALFITLLVIFELFVEITGMISRRYKPLLTILNIFIKSDKLPKIKESGLYVSLSKKLHGKLKYFVCICLLLTLTYAGYRYERLENNKPRFITQYKQAKVSTSLLDQVYKNIENVDMNRDKTKLQEYVAAYFAIDYYTLSNKTNNQIGGVDYYYQESLNTFKTYAKKDYYKDVNTLIKNDQNNIEVTSYELVSITDSHTQLSGLEDYNYYDVELELKFNKINPILNTDDIYVQVTLIDKDNHLSVTSFEKH